MNPRESSAAVVWTERFNILLVSRSVMVGVEWNSIRRAICTNDQRRSDETMSGRFTAERQAIRRSTPNDATHSDLCRGERDTQTMTDRHTHRDKASDRVRDRYWQREIESECVSE